MSLNTKYLKLATIKSKNHEIVLLTYGIALFLFILYLFTINNTAIDGDYQMKIFIMSWVGVLTFIYILLSWGKITGSIFTPYTIFILFFFLFNYGQPIMWAIGIHMPKEIGVAPIYPGQPVATGLDIFKAQIYTIACIWMMHFGALIAINKKTYRFDDRKLYQNEIYMIEKIRLNNIIFKVSAVFALISIPVTLWAAFQDLQVAREYGYRALYYSEHARTGASITGFFLLWFFPSLIGLLIGSNYNSRVRKIVYLTMAIYTLLLVASGDRGPWIYKLITLVWLSHATYKPLTKGKVIKFLFLSIIGVYLLDAIVSLRNSGINLESIFNSLSLNNSSIVKAFYEMGSSMNTTLYIQKFGGEFWPHGNTYLLAIGGLVTNRTLDLFGLSYGVLGEYLRQHLGISWGPGFSILAEPLINFGPIFAPLFMLILGLIIAKLFYHDSSINIQNQPLRLLFLVSSLDVLIRVNRDSIHVPLKNWFYGAFFFCLIIYFIKEMSITKQ